MYTQHIQYACSLYRLDGHNYDDHTTLYNTQFIQSLFVNK